MKNMKRITLSLLLFFPHALPESPSKDYSLLEAVTFNDVTKIRMLCKNRSLINQTNDYLATPLHIAAISGSVEIISLLLENNADLTPKGEYDLLPLHFASFKGHIAATELLIERGSDIAAKTTTGKTPLYLAVENNKRDMVDCLTRKLTTSQIDSADTENFTPLHIAALNGNVEIVKLLLAKGANVHAKGLYDMQPIHFAATKGHKEVLKILIQNGALPSNQTTLGKTALALALDGNHYDLVHYLRGLGS
jgi:ankyrin repeat protein